jgi:hypothetical protein
MHHHPPASGDSMRQQLRGSNTLVQTTSAVLLMLALTLAAFSFGGIFAITADDVMPSASRAAADPSLIAKTEQSTTTPLAPLTPTKPNAAVTGW